MKKINLLISLLGIVLVLTSFVSAHTGEDEVGHHSMMGGEYGLGFMWIFSLAFMILLFFMIVLLIVWLIQQINGGNKMRCCDPVKKPKKKK